VLPFQNTLATFQLTGKDIVASLEHGVSMVEEGKGAFPQVAGLKYSFDASVAPNTGRIKSVEVQENGAWAPIDETKLYTVATNNFTRGGGDGYDLFKTNAQNAYDYGPGLEQVVADYLTANRPFTPKLDGRITEIAAAVAAAPAEAAPAEPAPAPAEAAAPAAEPTVPAPPPGSADIAATPPTVEAAAPAAPAPAEAAPSAPAEGTHTIVAGDTLWAIAKKTYGAGSKWKTIADANPGVNANDLTIGSTLKIPPAS